MKSHMAAKLIATSQQLCAEIITVEKKVVRLKTELLNVLQKKAHEIEKLLSGAEEYDQEAVALENMLSQYGSTVEAGEEMERRKVGKKQKRHVGDSTDTKAAKQMRPDARSMHQPHEVTPVLTRMLVEGAQNGHAEMQQYLAVCYHDGVGVQQDLAKAVEWYLKAAEQGNANAQFSMAYCYEHGVGIDEDLAKSAELYIKAARQMSALAEGALNGMLSSTMSTAAAQICGEPHCGGL